MQSRRKFFTSLGKGSVAAAGSVGLLPALLTTSPAVARPISAVTGPLLAPSLPMPASSYATGFSEYHRVQIGEDIVIYASRLNLENALVSPLHNLIIYADTVTLKENIQLSGRRIYIHTRELYLNGKSLDVSGRPGEAYDTVAPGIANMGGAGFNGGLGRSGADAGQITIVAESVKGQGSLSANGGAGSQGQSGSNGGKGLPGPPGRPARCIDMQEGVFIGEQGGPGGKGGPAGAGGAGGAGGQHGSILVFTPNATTVGSVRLEQKGGDGGAAGTPGTGGPGGDGGPGGRNKKGKIFPGPRENDRFVCTNENTYGLVGPVGPVGDTPPPVAIGIKQPDQPTDGCIMSCDYTLLANAASLTQLQLTLHNLSLHYIGNEFDASATLLTWLARLAEARKPGPIAAGGAIPMAFASAPAEVTPEEWNALKDRTQALVAQMRAGLDFYGYPRNYVPLLSPEEYGTYLTQMFQLSRSIEVSHDNYRGAVANNVVRLQSVDDTLQANASIVDNLRQQVGGVDQRATSIKKTVSDLDVTILRLADEMERAEERFKSAIRREARANGGCPVGSILKLVAAVVITIETGGAAAPAIAASMSALETAQKFKDVVTRVKEIAAKIGEVQQSIAKLQQAYADFKHDIDQSLAATKLTMNSAEYKELFDKFKNMPEAKNYRQRIENYQTACNTRNEKLFEYTALVVKRETLKAEIAMQGTQADRLKAVRARTTDPNLLEWQVYMEVQLARAKEQLVRTLYEAARAHEYWSLQPANLGPVNDLNVAALQARYQNLLVAQRTVKVTQGQNEQPFSVKVDLNELDMSKYYNETTRHLDITFALTPESGQFAENPSWRRILVRNVEVDIPSLSTKGLKIDLIHGGSAQIDGDRPYYFSHKPRVTNIYYDDAGQLQTTASGSNLGGIDPATNNRTFVDLSPFAFWSLRVRSNDVIKPARIKRLTLRFSGMYLPTA